MPSKPKKKEEKQHLSQMGFSEMLSHFVGDSDELGLSKDYKDGSMSISSRMLMEKPSPSKKEKKSAKGTYGNLDMGDTEEAVLDDVSSLLPEDDLGDDYDPAFDDLIAKAFYEDEDVTLRNSLISMGRQYAIKGMEESSESSEVNKSFVRQEQQIGMLLDELNTDSAALQRDIELLRTMRTRSYKSLADLLSAKVSMANAKLSAIKELSAIQKTKYDINLKMKASRNEDGQNSGFAASQAIQKLLSVGRNNLVDMDDDYQSVGDMDAGDATFDDGRPETAIARAMDVPIAETDGDKFVEHEGEGVEYVLDIDDETDTRQIYAVDKNGDIVPDYPLPSNPEKLSFSINEAAGEATDQLQRRYRIRRNGEDVGDFTPSLYRDDN